MLCSQLTNGQKKGKKKEKSRKRERTRRRVGPPPPEHLASKSPPADDECKDDSQAPSLKETLTQLAGVEERMIKNPHDTSFCQRDRTMRVTEASTDHAGVHSQPSTAIKGGGSPREGPRRRNVRIEGIPESFLGGAFGPDALPRPPTVHRAPRLPVQRRQDGAPTVHRLHPPLPGQATNPAARS